MTYVTVQNFNTNGRIETFVTVEPGLCHSLSLIQCVIHGNVNVPDLGFVQSADSSRDSYDVDGL